MIASIASGLQAREPVGAPRERRRPRRPLKPVDGTPASINFASSARKAPQGL